MPRGVKKAKEEEKKNVSVTKTEESTLNKPKMKSAVEETAKSTESKVRKKKKNSTTKTTLDKPETESVMEENSVLAESKTENVQDSDTVNYEEQTSGKNEKTEVTEETTPKTTGSKKTRAVKKQPKKEEQLLSDIIIQYGGEEVSALEIVKKVKQDCKDKGYRKQIRRVSIYIKPEDGKAYYALEDSSDHVSLFEDTHESKSAE